jgi:O-antigen ligase
LVWLAVFPLSYYFFSFPREGSIITLERVVILIALTGLFLKSSSLIALPKELRRFGIAWLSFIAIAGTTLGKSSNILNSARYILDAFLMPLLLAFCVIAGLEVRRRLAAIHTATCISSTICATVAAAEIVTGQDLLPVQNSVMFYAGGIARPNGPFAANDQLALVGALSFFFLLFLRAALGPGVSPSRRLLHFVGTSAALGTALMPMFRSVAITLLLALIIDTLWEQRASRRAWRIVLILASVGLIFVAPLFLPDMLVQDRSGADNVYGRVAQFKQSFRVFADHPVIGVGFYNFHNFVAGDPEYLESYEGVPSLDSPHNNLTQVLAETGLLGFVPYVLSQLFLFRTMWQSGSSSGSGHLVRKCCIYLFLSYWITGLTESSGYSPLNLIYLFIAAVAYKYGATEPDFTELQAVDPLFSMPA